jgi:hypothetical protein
MKKLQKIGFVLGYFLILTQFFNYSLVAQITNVKTDSLFDPSLYDPEIINAAYPKNNGPNIYLDEGHYNRHTYGGLGSFIAFRNVLRNDGYQIVSFKDKFTNNSLQDVRIMVIALAQNKENLGESNWFNPTFSAFKRSEIITVNKWVENGGSLFLIVDHHPFAGAAKDLATEFGFKLFNGHALDTIRYPSYFHRTNNTLHSNIITEGRDITEKIDSIITFSGAAMKLPDGASPIITFDDIWLQWLPDIAWNFNNIEPESISGYAQGAFIKFGKGKIVIFADGNTFSAQIDEDGEIAGFIDPYAKYNYKLLLNIIHYLDGLLD